MHSLLKTTVERPVHLKPLFTTDEPKPCELDRHCRRRLHSMHINSFDWEQGGLCSPVKFIDRDSVEYALLQARENIQSEAQMATLTLDKAMALLDPIWGGVYQYSTQRRWDQPHHRKSMATQAGHMRIYALAYAQLKQDRYLAIAQAIRAYISRFLTGDDGTFFCGQSDSIPGLDPRLYFSLHDKERQRIGIPDIDRRILTRENGWAIEALATLYEYGGDYCSLLMALKANRTIGIQYRNNSGVWLTNSVTDNAHHLAENLAMARALLQLYRVTFERQFLDGASETLDAINRLFRQQDAGFVSVAMGPGPDMPRQIDENISLARFANLMYHYTGKDRYKEIAVHGFRYLSVFEVATSRMEEAGILLLEQELKTTPLSFHIEGEAPDAFNNAFVDIAHRYPGWYKLVTFTAAESDRVTVQIDGIRSRPVYTTERLQDLLQYC